MGKYQPGSQDRLEVLEHAQAVRSIRLIDSLQIDSQKLKVVLGDEQGLWRLQRDDPPRSNCYTTQNEIDSKYNEKKK